MLPTQSVIDGLAERIERAYRLRKAYRHGGCSTDRVWTVAAIELLKIHDSHPTVPVDPELYVAAQSGESFYCNPWLELTQAESGRRYRWKVREIVRSLRAELTREVTLAEERIEAGRSIGKVLKTSGQWLSALGRFIVAQRAGRTVLAQRFLREAVEQHRSCPLYREASSRLLSPGEYPVAESGAVIKIEDSSLGRRLRTQVSLN
jgi:hypothetical protein